MRTVLVFGFVLISACALAQSQPQTTPKPANEASDYQQIRTNDALETIASQLSAIREQTARIEKQSTDREANPFWPPVPSNWFLILLTAGAVVAAFRTLHKLERQTTAAETSASAAITSVNFASETLKTTNRAYLLFTDFQTITDTDDNNRIIRLLIAPIFRNTGNLPAHASCTTSIHRCTPAQPDHPAIVKDDEPILSRSLAVVGKGGVFQGLHVGVLVDEFDDVVNEKVLIYLHALVSYRDGFSDTPIRHTFFCRRIKLIADPRTQDPKIQGRCVFLEGGPAEHNSAD